jgi:hypothetical protein
MQIMIDISKEKYDEIMSMDWVNCRLFFDEELRAIHDGTPLPKGHGDLIDVNRKITVPIYDEQYEEWGEKILTVREALNRWSEEGITAKDVVISADKGRK